MKLKAGRKIRGAFGSTRIWDLTWGSRVP